MHTLSIVRGQAHRAAYGSCTVNDKAKSKRAETETYQRQKKTNLRSGSRRDRGRWRHHLIWSGVQHLDRIGLGINRLLHGRRFNYGSDWEEWYDRLVSRINSNPEPR